LADGEDFVRLDNDTLSGPGDEAGHGGAVPANVENASAAEQLVEKAAFEVEIGAETEPGGDGAHLADGACADQFEDAGDLRMAPVHVGFHEEDIVFPRSLQHLDGLVVMHAHRLFAEDMLLGLRGAEGPFPVVRMRRGDVDDIDIGVGQESLIGAVGMRKLVKVGEFVGFGLGATGNGDELSLFRAKDTASEFMRNAAGADDSPTKLGHKERRKDEHLIVAEARASARR